MDVQTYQGKIATLITEHGWMVQAVGAERPWAYTIGLTEYGHPELLMVGLNQRTAQLLLNDLALPVKEESHRYLPGDRVAGIVRDYDLLIRGPIDPVKAEMTQAVGFYGEIDALQVLWPAVDGLFPTVGDVHPKLTHQPLAALL